MEQLLYIGLKVAKVLGVWIYVQTILMGIFLWFIAYQVQFKGAQVSWYPPMPDANEMAEMREQNKGLKPKKIS